MRKEFAEFLHCEMSSNEKIILLTGDLGYGLWDKIRIDYPDRFYKILLKLKYDDGQEIIHGNNDEFEFKIVR